MHTHHQNTWPPPSQSPASAAPDSRVQGTVSMGVRNQRIRRLIVYEAERCCPVLCYMVYDTYNELFATDTLSVVLIVKLWGSASRCFVRQRGRNFSRLRLFRRMFGMRCKIGIEEDYVSEAWGYIQLRGERAVQDGSGSR